ncbi:FHA domain-containing protein [Sphaerisporangium sp. B11E5]|uniref:FHA domain-containing protein n=1 Tax=Sphaerisporangium sp. B11E5 TaxID=3153563 RepID=UPI00325CEF9B
MTVMRVEKRDHVVELTAQDRLTFGRARDCTICLDPEDTGISRVAGAVTSEGGTWWLSNRSETRPLSVVDDLGFRSVLAPGRRVAVETPTKVLIDGSRHRHGLTLTPAGAGTAPPPPVPASGTTPTATGAEVMISAADRLAMVALFMGYLEDPPKYDPHPKDYAAAAARLGWKRTTLVKRIEYLRTRLDAAGVPNMKGFNALANLAEYAISRGLVTREDLAELRR